MKHTGYGNAAGLLASRGMLGGGKSKTCNDYSSDEDDSDTEEYTAVADMVDPITGLVIIAFQCLLPSSSGRIFVTYCTSVGLSPPLLMHRL